jgi:hypothetical protein
METKIINMKHQWQRWSAICGILLLLCGMVMAAEPSAEKGKHLFILSGQSNMREPLPGSFTESVSQVFGKDNVLVVTYGKPSQPIRQWYKLWAAPAAPADSKPIDTSSNGQLYDQLLQIVKNKIKGEKIASVTFVWMQGEADAEGGWGSVYEQSFYGILDQFKKDLDLQKINFVIGRINDYWLPSKGIVDGDIVRATEVKIGEANENGAWVDTDDLNKGVNPWGGFELDSGHFPPAGYRVLGQRFARKACQIIDPQLKLDEQFFDAVFFDSTVNIKTHAAVSKAITGSKPDEKYTDEKSGLTSLVDGKYGATDQPDKQWLGFASTPDGVEFVIDLGQSQDVSGVAISILVDPVLGAIIPKQTTIFVSNDSATFEDVPGKSFKVGHSAHVRRQKPVELKRQPLLILAETNKANGRYIKVKLVTESPWLFVDEIVVNPIPKTRPFPVEVEHPRSK